MCGGRILVPDAIRIPGNQEQLFAQRHHQQRASSRRQRNITKQQGGIGSKLVSAHRPAHRSRRAIATAVSKIPLLQHKQIHFVHVPKTGGTSIEDFGKSHGRLWGRFAPSAGCKHGRECTLPATVPGTPPSIKECVHWHIPPKYKVFDGAENATYFTVLREPFSRLISQATYLTGMLHTFKTCAGIDNYVYQKVSTFKANGKLEL